jgi:iron complex transport system substrate-binding protein
MPVRRTLGAAVAALLLTACGSSGEETRAEAQEDDWSFASGDGKTYTLDERPTRIIAHAYAAAALMEFGIKPVGVYADGPIKDDVGLRGVDFSGVAVLSETWGKIDVEKAATLRPDLIVGDWWPAEKAYSGMEGGVEARSKKLKELAPIVGPSQGSSVVSLIEGYERLA